MKSRLNQSMRKSRKTKRSIMKMTFISLVVIRVVSSNLQRKCKLRANLKAQKDNQSLQSSKTKIS
jgi:hypothetical protein